MWIKLKDSNGTEKTFSKERILSIVAGKSPGYWTFGISKKCHLCYILRDSFTITVHWKGEEVRHQMNASIAPWDCHPPSIQRVNVE